MEIRGMTEIAMGAQITETGTREQTTESKTALTGVKTDEIMMDTTAVIHLEEILLTETQIGVIRAGTILVEEISTAEIQGIQGLVEEIPIEEIRDLVEKITKFLPIMTGLAKSVTMSTSRSERNAIDAENRKTEIQETIMADREIVGRDKINPDNLNQDIMMDNHENSVRQKESQQTMLTTKLQNH
tara:strand:+ start:125 stop:682 length:558 start_codon:yes stop_codon:yes gene_type:complete